VSTGTNVLNFGDYDSPGTTTVNGSITDSTAQSQPGLIVAVAFYGGGQLRLLGPNNYSGGTAIVESGYLLLGHDNALGTAAQTLTISGYSPTVAATGAARTIPAAISVIVGAEAFVALGGFGQAITFNGTVDLGGATRSITVRSDATFAGAVSNGGIIKLGPATLTLAASGGNTYAGPTTINAGTLSVTNTTGSATGTGPVTVNGGSLFGTLRGTGIISGPVTINAGPTAAQNAVISPGTPTTNGSSTLTLNGGLALHGTYNATIDPNGTASSLLTIAGILDLTGGSARSTSRSRQRVRRVRRTRWRPSASSTARSPPPISPRVMWSITTRRRSPLHPCRNPRSCWSSAPRGRRCAGGGGDESRPSPFQRPPGEELAVWFCEMVEMPRLRDCLYEIISRIPAWFCGLFRSRSSQRSPGPTGLTHVAGPAGELGGGG
jgi:autotransporter-associated beta strand protein